MNVLLLTGALLLAPPPAATTEQPVAPIAAAGETAEVPAAPGAAPDSQMPPASALPPAPPPATPATAEPARGRDIVVTGRGAWEAPDPFADINEKAFDATEAVDKALIGPLALAYKDNVPKPVRDGVHNFLYNLREPVVFLNFLLQLKIGKAAETAGRFGLNSTIGVAGVLDVARRRPFRLPRRSNGFANTFGYYGIRPGPFMYLPIVGPTTVRDLVGGALDRLLFPFVYGSRITRPAFAVPFAVFGALDHRAEFDDTLHALHDGQADPYARSRDFYLQRRQNEIDELKDRGAKNSSPMSEAPTAPIRVKERSDAPGNNPAPAEPPTSQPVAPSPEKPRG